MGDRFPLLPCMNLSWLNEILDKRMAECQPSLFCDIVIIMISYDIITLVYTHFGLSPFSTEHLLCYSLILFV